ncbi:MAG: thiamine-phosphate kinase [Candidatus Dormiibacterota bacterium]
MSATWLSASTARRGFDAGGPTLADIGESELLRQVSAIALEDREAARDLEVESGDDAAVWRVPVGCQVALSQDATVEGVDFRRTTSDPGSVGARALQVALSDLAGMGAEPRLCLVTVCASETTQVEDLIALQRGLCAVAASVGCAVAGGDISAIDGPLVIDVSVVGTTAPGRCLRRDRGRPGDVLLVTGHLGGAAAGLRILLQGLEAPTATAERWLDRQLRPRARLEEGRALARLGVSCAGDLSDGLLVDVGRITEASGCGAELWLESVPVDPELPAALDAAWTEAALGGGEDFELVAAVAPDRLEALLEAWPAQLQPLQVVGRLDAGTGVRLLDRAGGEPLPLPAVVSRHFRRP